MIYELREYVAVPGRLPALMSLFNEVSKPLMAKHGLDLVYAGMTWIGEDSYNAIAYTVRFNDVAELDSKWSALLADPLWNAELTARTADGPVVGRMTRRLLDASPFE